MARITKHDNPQGNWKRFEIQFKSNFRESPLSDTSQAVGHDYYVDKDVGYRAPEGELEFENVLNAFSHY